MRDDRNRRFRFNLRTTDEKDCIDQKGDAKLANRIEYLHHSDNGQPGPRGTGTEFTNTYYFPHLALGGGWQTVLTYVNYSQQAVICQTNACV